MVIVSFKLKIPENDNVFCSLSESNKQDRRDRTLDLPFFFHSKHIASFRVHFSPPQGERLPYWDRGNFCGNRGKISQKASLRKLYQDRKLIL